MGKDEPAGALAVTGSTFSAMPKTTMSTIPETNSGTVDSDRPATLMLRSTALPRFSAARTPPRMLSGTTITKATAASLSERPRAGQRKLLDRRPELV